MTDLLRKPIFRHLWRASSLVQLWSLYLAVVAAVTLAVSFFADIETSAWNIGAQLPPWFMLALGIYATAIYLPLYVAHGHTRKEFLAQALAWVMLLAPTAAALMTVPFVIERFVYRSVGWTQAFEDDFAGLFTAPDQYGWIFVGFWLTFLIYTMVGAVLRAAFYGRSWHGMAGLLMVPVALLLIGTGDLPTGRNVTDLTGSLALELTAPLTVTTCLLAFVAAGAITWGFVRDLPVRSNVP